MPKHDTTNEVQSDHERGYINGNRAAWLYILTLATRELGADSADGARAVLLAERIGALIKEAERLSEEAGTPVRIMAAADTTAEGLVAAVLAEREACAEIADAFSSEKSAHDFAEYATAGAAIRARSKP